VTFSGPTTIEACRNYSWSVSVTNDTSGYWEASWGWGAPKTDYGITMHFYDAANSYTGWIRYTATGPGGQRTETYNITVTPDSRVPHVRSTAECEQAARG
jgi:hypothetical protein